MILDYLYKDNNNIDKDVCSGSGTDTHTLKTREPIAPCSCYVVWGVTTSPIFDQSESEKLSHTNSQTKNHHTVSFFACEYLWHWEPVFCIGSSVSSHQNKFHHPGQEKHLGSICPAGADSLRRKISFKLVQTITGQARLAGLIKAFHKQSLAGLTSPQVLHQVFGLQLICKKYRNYRNYKLPSMYIW